MFYISTHQAYFKNPATQEFQAKNVMNKHFDKVYYFSVF